MNLSKTAHSCLAFFRMAILQSNSKLIFLVRDKMTYKRALKIRGLFISAFLHSEKPEIELTENI